MPFLVDFSEKFEHLLNVETVFACTKHSTSLCDVCAEDEERVDHLLCFPSGLLWTGLTDNINNWLVLTKNWPVKLAWSSVSVKWQPII